MDVKWGEKIMENCRKTAPFWIIFTRHHPRYSLVLVIMWTLQRREESLAESLLKNELSVITYHFQSLSFDYQPESWIWQHCERSELRLFATYKTLNFCPPKSPISLLFYDALLKKRNKDAKFSKNLRSRPRHIDAMQLRSNMLSIYIIS